MSGFDFTALISGYPLQAYAPGERIFIDGDEGHVMYVVRSGVVAIMSSGAVLETVRPGETFGELSLIDGSPRSATAVAREPTEVAAIDEKAFLNLVEHEPRFALDLLRRLAGRLRRTTEYL